LSESFIHNCGGTHNTSPSEICSIEASEVLPTLRIVFLGCAGMFRRAGGGAGSASDLNSEQLTICTRRRGCFLSLLVPLTAPQQIGVLSKTSQPFAGTSAKCKIWMAHPTVPSSRHRAFRVRDTPKIRGGGSEGAGRNQLRECVACGPSKAIYRRCPDRSSNDWQERFPRFFGGAIADEVGLFRSQEKGRGPSVFVECVKGRIAR